MRIDPKAAYEDADDERCRVCGRRGELTFEHLPPRAAGNASAVWMYGLDSWLSRDEATGRPGGRATILQRGAGVHSLCSRCNATAGARYVSEYLRWAERAGAGLAGCVPPLAEIDQQLAPAYVRTRFENVRPGRFLKQVATMLLAISPGGFPPQHPDLTAFAQDPEWVGLPPEYQFYLALYAGPQARFNGGAARIRPDGQGGFATDFLMEVAYAPFAVALSLDESVPAGDTANISSFADVGVEQVATVDLTMQVGFGHTAFPLDYRSKAKLEADRSSQAA